MRAHEGEDISIPVSAPASQVGRWLPPKTSPIVGIHAAVLPTGKVLLYSYPDMMGMFQIPPPTDRSEAFVWNPKGGAFKDVTWDYDVFCSGHSFLADGSLYVTGGSDPTACDTGGLAKSFLFDPFAEEWRLAPDLHYARYYPSNVTLGDGRVLILSGYNQNCHAVPAIEVYRPGHATTTVLGGGRILKLYPQVHLLTTGKVAMVGPEAQTAELDPDTGAWQNVATTRLGVKRNYGTSFEVPGEPNKIMICGGYRNTHSEPTDSCEVIDLAASHPSWRFTAPMHYPRAHLNPVILPDKTVLMVGGGTRNDYDIPVDNPELYDPRTDTWTLLPPQVHGRMYHSTAVLLPSGRVLSSGHDQHRLGQDPNEPENGHWNEVYRPAYLFRGARPKIRRAPAEIGYHDHFEVASAQAASIESVVLISLSATTHATNTTQRLVELDYSLDPDGTLLVRAPAHANAAPPGYYMLFILNGNGVPSKAKILKLGEGA